MYNAVVVGGDSADAVGFGQHQINLFCAGLESNTATHFTLQERRTALLEHLRRLKSTSGEPGVHGPNLKLPKTSGGVFAMMGATDVHMFTFASPSRGIAHSKPWRLVEIPPGSETYCFYPAADVIAFAGRWGPKCVFTSVAALENRELIPAQWKRRD